MGLYTLPMAIGNRPVKTGESITVWLLRRLPDAGTHREPAEQPNGYRREAMENRKYRHELKYSITFAQYLFLRSRLIPVMRQDGNANEEGQYLIRSIYFDNYRDRALREKIDGTAVREKFRIRYYNDDLSFLNLEKKRKVGDLCMKLDAQIEESDCRRLLAGDTDWMLGHPAELVRELYIKMKSEQLRPRVLVSYLREAYVCRAGNVRITLDSDIRSTLFHREFLEAVPVDMDISDEPERRVLEIKYDEFLPEAIAGLIWQGDCRRQSFSKYAACRRFG